MLESLCLNKKEERLTCSLVYVTFFIETSGISWSERSLLKSSA